MSRGKPSTIASVRTWLMREPKPTHLIVDGKRIDVPKTPRPFPELFATLVALKPEQVQCYVGDTLARACEWPSEGSDDGDSDASPELSDVQRFAQLIAEAYQRSDDSPLLRHALEFIDRQSQLISNKDREIERLRTHNMKLQGQLLAYSAAPVDGVEGDNAVLQLLSSFVGGVQAQNATPPDPPSHPAPNGKGRRMKET